MRPHLLLRRSIASRAAALTAFACLSLSSLSSLTGCSSSFHVPLRTTEAAASLEQVTRGGGEQRNPTLSPDGKLMAFEQKDSALAAARIRIARLDGREPTRDVEVGREPAFMPDGSGLLLVAPAHAPGLRDQLLQTLGASVMKPAFAAPLGDPFLMTAWPAVSPDGHSVAIALVKTGVYESDSKKSEWMDPALALTDLRGSGVTTIGSGSQPAWSPDGKRIAFVRRVGDRLHLFVASPTQFAKAIQISGGADDDAHPAWSPDGSMIVFCSTPAGSMDARGTNLFVVRADGSALRQLTEGETDSCRPAWSADGRIYFHSNLGGAYHVWRLEPR